MGCMFDIRVLPGPCGALSNYWNVYMCTPYGQVVDKHFNDNWVIPVYMGILADLSEEWAPYKAAREALAMDCLQVRAPTRSHS